MKQICTQYNLGAPKFDGNKVHVGGITFEDSSTALSEGNNQCNTGICIFIKFMYISGETIEARLSVSVLRQLHKHPRIGFDLVPEHVETRSLYRSDRPGIEQVYKCEIFNIC